MKRVISTPNAPAAIGPYSQAIEVNGTLYISGQVPIDPQTAQVVDGDITVQTEQVMKNIGAILEAAGLGAEWTTGGLRFTVGSQNTLEDIEYTIASMPEIVKKISHVNQLLA